MLEPDWWDGVAQEVLELVATYRAKLNTLTVSAKPDDTLLTDADLAVQDLIIRRIMDADARPCIIAEEDRKDAGELVRSTSAWIVDPIDGTAQFVKPDAVEYCTAIARYERGRPVAALVVAPEFGADRTPLVVTAFPAERAITVNRRSVSTGNRVQNGRASATRSRGVAPSGVEIALLDRQYEVKTRTTSQTLDLVRTALDLTPFAPSAKPFDLFHRREQKLWDGAAGICLAVTGGLAVVDERGEDLLPFDEVLLGAAPPVLPSTVVGLPALVEELCGAQRGR